MMKWAVFSIISGLIQSLLLIWRYCFHRMTIVFLKEWNELVMMQTLHAIYFEIGMVVFGKAQKVLNMGRWTEVRLEAHLTLPCYPISFYKLFFGTVGRLPSSVVLQDDENRGDDVEAHAAPSIQSRGGYQLLSTDNVSALLQVSYMAIIWYLLLFLLKQSRPMANSSINMGSYRTLFPFFLIIAVVLLLVWRLIVSPGLTSPTKKCPEGTSSYWAQPGNNCWELSRKNGWTLDKFKEINPAVDCDPLMPGTSICLPPPKKQIRRRVWKTFFWFWMYWTRMYEHRISFRHQTNYRPLLLLLPPLVQDLRTTFMYNQQSYSNLYNR